VTPGTADLALASPLFPKIVLSLPDNRTLVLHAPGASTAAAYVRALSITGPPLATPASPCLPGATSSAPAPNGRWDRPWLPPSIITTGGTLTYRLSAEPDTSWGTAPSDSPPSFASGRLPAVGYSVPSGGTALQVGRPAPITLGIAEIVAGSTSVRWSADSVSGLRLSAQGGFFIGSSGGSGTSSGPSSTGTCPSPGTETQSLTVDAMRPGTFTLVVHMQSGAGTALPPVVLNLTASA
jgi:hypothetical protein